MPCIYEWNTDLDLLEIACTGRITRACILQAIDALEDCPKKIADRNEFRDLGGVREVAMDSDQMFNLAQLMRMSYLRAGHRKRVAFYAPSGPGRVIAGYMRDALDSLIHVRAEMFQNREAAMTFVAGGNAADRLTRLLRLG